MNYQVTYIESNFSFYYLITSDNTTPDTWGYLNEGLPVDLDQNQDNIADWVDEIASAEWKWFKGGRLVGFTGHEMLPEFGIINMNGRCYDPVLGRMLQVDNFIQNPFSSQSYNRYTYAMNNPLRYTDPSGETWWDVVAGASIVGGAILSAYGVGGDLGSQLIGAGIAHFANSVAGVINQGQSWSQASKNAGFTFQGSFTTNWGYSSQQAAPNPMFAGGTTGGKVPNMTPNYAMADGSLSASLDDHLPILNLNMFGNKPIEQKLTPKYLYEQFGASFQILFAAGLIDLINQTDSKDWEKVAISYIYSFSFGDLEAKDFPGLKIELMAFQIMDLKNIRTEYPGYVVRDDLGQIGGVSNPGNRPFIDNTGGHFFRFRPIGEPVDENNNKIELWINIFLKVPDAF